MSQLGCPDPPTTVLGYSVPPLGQDSFQGASVQALCILDFSAITLHTQEFLQIEEV